MGWGGGSGPCGEGAKLPSGKLGGASLPAMYAVLPAHPPWLQVRELAALPMAEDIPIAFNSCRAGPRWVGGFVGSRTRRTGVN